MAINGGQYAVTATATNLTTALGLTGGNLPSGGSHCAEITVKNAAGALNKAYLGKSTVTNVPANAHVELSADQGFTFMPTVSGRPNTDEIFVVGTVNAANIVFIELTL